MRFLFLTSIVLAATLGGCATTSLSAQKTEKVTKHEKSQPVRLSDDDKTLNALAESHIPEKSCGMVLWTLDAQKPIAVFRYIAGAEGEMRLGDHPIKLKRVDYDGASGFGVFEDQKFESQDGLTAEVSAQFGLGFDGGAYLERGLIKLKDESGWSLVSPAAGIAGCRG